MFIAKSTIDKDDFVIHENPNRPPIPRGIDYLVYAHVSEN